MAGPFYVASKAMDANDANLMASSAHRTNPDDIHLYQIQWFNSTSSTWTNLCEPRPCGVDDGRAVFTRGYWQKLPADPGVAPKTQYKTDDPYAFGLSCWDGVAAKCMRWGYKEWQTLTSPETGMPVPMRSLYVAGAYQGYRLVLAHRGLSNGLLSRPAATRRGRLVVVVVAPGGDGPGRSRKKASVGRTARPRRIHNELPLPPEADSRDPREFLATIWSGPVANFALPAFVGDAVRRVLTEEAPACERALVLSHNDVNPTNLVYDGENLLLLDWETAGPNDPFYDLAAISVFLRMDERTCQRLLAAYDGEPVSRLSARFAYSRRLVAALCGAAFLHLARQSGHTGATGGKTLGSTPSLGDFYQRMRAGSLSLATGEGQWWFGLALMKDSVAL